MHYIIETSDQLKYLQLNSCYDSCFINIIPNNDSFHPKLTGVNCVYYRCSQTKGYILPINHTESFNLDWSEVLDFIKQHKIIHVIDKKFHDYFIPETVQCTDINFKIINNGKDAIKTNEYNTVAHNYFYRQHYFRNNVNSLIPISKHYEKWESIYPLVEDYLDNQVDQYFDYEYTGVFKTIEENGIKVSPSKFKNYFETTHDEFSITKNKIHTKFNLYNITTRPSNAFNNINFAALPKENGARQSFIPSNDILVEFDFSAYHPSIISKLVNYDLGDKPYQHLAEVMEVDENEAKEITFQNLYGGIRPELRDKPYFKEINDFVSQLWKDFNTLGFIFLGGFRKLSKDKLDNPSPQKLFNYLIQSKETENNVKILTELFEYLKDKQTKIVMYTYDSILFDFSKHDTKQCLVDIKSIIEKNGFKTKFQHGQNYGFTD